MTVSFLLIGFDVLLIGPIGASISKGKGRSAVTGALAGAILGVLGILILAVESPKIGPMQTCPRCAEKVLAAASVCRYCGGPLTPDHTPQPRGSSFTTVVLLVLVVVIGGLAVMVLGQQR